ncbi:hypothetical protein ABZ686_10750 [Streptomyces sp. NPDC006992]|uniref:hypothetical protein n=2 Tax=unclassified Streptomyces TaxID=2593676 RepID=UPI00340705BB
MFGIHKRLPNIFGSPETFAAWSRFEGHADQYKRIRDAQIKLTRAAGSDAVPPLVWVEISNVTDVWPQWNPNENGKPQTPPWPTANPNREFIVQHGREWLMWLLTTPGVKVWVPTPDGTAAAQRAQVADAKERGGKPRDLQGPRMGRGGESSPRGCAQRVRGGAARAICRNRCAGVRDPKHSGSLISREGGGQMTLRFIGTTSEHGNCPTLYEVVETGEILVQGEIETDPEHLAQLRDVKPSETFVRVPRELLTRFAPRDVEPDAEQQVKE